MQPKIKMISIIIANASAGAGDAFGGREEKKQAKKRTKK
jgi:hypothetical protein